MCKPDSRANPEDDRQTPVIPMSHGEAHHLPRLRTLSNETEVRHVPLSLDYAQVHSLHEESTVPMPTVPWSIAAPSAPLPTYFISRGGGPWPLVISGHWEEREFAVMSSARPPMIYDYSGLP